MPLTADMRRDIDLIRNYLFGGGYPNPMANAEQLSFLFFFYLIEGIDSENAERAKVLKQKYESIFAGSWELKNPLNAPKKGDVSIPRDRFCWSVWARGLGAVRAGRGVRVLRGDCGPIGHEFHARRAAHDYGADLTHPGRDAR
jgi:type I restriction enzyme M protein